MQQRLAFTQAQFLHLPSLLQRQQEPEAEPEDFSAILSVSRGKQWFLTNRIIDFTWGIFTQIHLFILILPGQAIYWVRLALDVGGGTRACEAILPFFPVDPERISYSNLEV